MTNDSSLEERPEQRVSLTVNGERVTGEVEPRWKLSDFLRYRADQTDVKVGCEHGACGACTVELDGNNVKSCMLYAVQADESEVQTATGLNESDGDFGPIQEAFHENHGLQCGFCTNGFVMATKALLDENPDPDRDDIDEALAGNICRCTGYVNIIKSVEEAADQMNTSQAEGDD